MYRMVNCDVNSETIKVKSRRTSEIPDNDTKLNVSDCKRLPSKSSVTAISRGLSVFQVYQIYSHYYRKLPL